MRTSENIKNVVAALFALQQELEPVKKDSTNPHFKSRYASLEAVSGYVIEMANKHGLLIVQGGGENQPDGTIAVETRFVHVTSGEWIASDVIMPLQKQDPQGAGSAITYGRRYNICAMLCISTEEDDDGEAASWPPTQRSGAKAGGASSAPATPAEPSCPKCSGRMWDNRATKKNPRMPDYKCRDKSCDGVIWPPRESKQPVAAGFDEPPPYDPEEMF